MEVYARIEDRNVHVYTLVVRMVNVEVGVVRRKAVLDTDRKQLLIKPRDRVRFHRSNPQVSLKIGNSQDRRANAPRTHEFSRKGLTFDSLRCILI